MISLTELQDLMTGLDDWSLESDAINKIFSFQNFNDAKDFVNKVADVAQKIGHHPDIMWNYNQVRITLTTHSENGLTKRDFEVAKEIDQI